jgi:hypothetical protein
LSNRHNDQQNGSLILRYEVPSGLINQDENPGEKEPANYDGGNKNGTNALVSTIAQIVPPLDGFEANQNLSINAGNSIQTSRPAREILLANASTARKKQLKQIDEAEALQYLRSLQGDILIEDHITDTRITKYDFTEIELDQVLQKFTEDPLPKKSEEQILQFMDTIEALEGQIGHSDTIRLKYWSDTYGDKSVPLQHIVDAKAIFIISCELKRNQKNLLNR